MGEPILNFPFQIRNHLFLVIHGPIYLLYIILGQSSMSKEAAFWELGLPININILIIIKINSQKQGKYKIFRGIVNKEESILMM
jgi:hypothetical protein